MNKKSHDRSPDKIGFSVALPKQLLAQIQEIADTEHRTRNRQIEHFLYQSVARWNADHASAKEQEELAAAEDPALYGKAVRDALTAGLTAPGKPATGQAQPPSAPAKGKPAR